MNSLILHRFFFHDFVHVYSPREAQMTTSLSLFRSFFVKFHHDIPNTKGTRGQKPFLYIDKCHNSDKLSKFNNPKPDIVGTNAYAKFE